MENYEKKYKEAVKSIKELSDRFNDDNLTNELGTIFPELKESDDEKTSKALIKLVKACGIKTFDNITNEQFIAWLEKLGEKSENIIDEDKVGRAYQNGYDDGMRVALGEQAICVNDPVIKFTTVEDDENNPKWTEEDEEIKNIFVDSINLLSWNNICLDNKSKRDCISWIDNIKNRIQPKEGWSEEDERMLALINNLLWEGYKSSEGENIPTWKEIVHWFKSLNISN